MHSGLGAKRRWSFLRSSFTQVSYVWMGLAFNLCYLCRLCKRRVWSVILVYHYRLFSSYSMLYNSLLSIAVLVYSLPSWIVSFLAYYLSHCHLWAPATSTERRSWWMSSFTPKEINCSGQAHNHRLSLIAAPEIHINLPWRSSNTWTSSKNNRELQ